MKSRLQPRHISLLLANLALAGAFVLPACSGEFTAADSETDDGGADGSTRDVVLHDVSVAETTTAEGGGVCCPVVADPCSACGSTYLGGWASSLEGCSGQGGPCDGLIGVVQDAHGCPVITTGVGACCGCGGPDAGASVDAIATLDAPVFSDGAARKLDCVVDAAVTMGPGDPSIKDTLTGTNGTFVDTCDSSGNLTDYVCESANLCGQGPDPLCTQFLTGKVVPKSLDCSGHCVDGRCDGRCPATGQAFHYVSVDGGGGATIQNDTDGRTYVCKLVFDSSQDTYDCTKGPVAGSKGTIFSLGLSGNYCTGGAFGNIGVSENGVSPVQEDCAYSCTLP